MVDEKFRLLCSSVPSLFLLSFEYFTRFLREWPARERKKGRKKNPKDTKGRFPAINYHDRLERESKSIRLRDTRARGKKREEKVDVPTFCHGVPWSSNKFVVSLYRGQALGFTKFGDSTHRPVMHCADEFTATTR